MAYPDYSIVVVDVTTNGVTTPLSMSFYDNNVARKVFNDAIASNKRAFLFEKPKPTDFNRNDALPLVDAHAAEAALLAAAPITDWTGNPEVDRLINAELEVINASYDLAKSTGEKVASGYVQVGTQIRKTYQKATGFIYHLFDNIQFEAAGAVKFSISVDHKTYSVVTTGSVAISTSVVNDCPEYGVFLRSQENNTLYVELHGVQYLLGTFVINYIADGQCGEIEGSRDYSYTPSGTELGTWNAPNGNNETYWSDGTGWYYTTYMNGEPSNCLPAGEEIDATLRTEPSPLYNYVGESRFVVGSEYYTTLADGYCGGTVTRVVEWLPSGTELLRTVSPDGYITTVYTCDGSGGISVSIDDQTPVQPPSIDPHENYQGYCEANPSDPICQCPADGATADWLGVPFPKIVEPVNLQYDTFTMEGVGQKTWPARADGHCSFVKDMDGETTEWNLSEGDSLDGSVTDEQVYSEGGIARVFTTNGGVSNYVVAAVIATPIQSTGQRWTITPNQSTYPSIASNYDGGFGTLLTTEELATYTQGDYRVDSQGAFIYAYWGLRQNYEVQQYDPFFPRHWTSADIQFAAVTESLQTKSMYPIQLPYASNSPVDLPNKKAKGQLQTRYVTGVIYAGRQVAWPTIYAPQISGQSQGLRWYQEEDLIARGVLQRDSRWTLPTPQKISSFFSRNSGKFGGQSNGTGGSSLTSYLPPYPAVCPMFTKNFHPMIKWAGEKYGTQAPSEYIGFVEGSILRMTGGVSRQLFKGYKFTVKCDGNGGLEYTPDLSRVIVSE